MNIKLTPWKPEEYLNTPEDIKCYLLDCYEEGFDVFLAAINDVVKSAGMIKIAEELHFTKDTLPLPFPKDKQLPFETVLRILDFLGFKFKVQR